MSSQQPLSAIQYQTQEIQNQIPQIDERSSTYNEKTKYQIEMYNSLKYINQAFLIFYIILFSVIHLLFLEQYIRGIKRDEIADSIWLTVFFLYPYMIYYVERTIYFCITYVLALIYGQTYVYEFDQMLLSTDFYRDPEESKKSTSVLSG
jgi:hypothetical protein